jgi:type IV pilus assembly protein PilF
LDLGVAYLREGQPRSALQALRKAKERHPGHAPVHNALALAYQRLSFPDKARAAFERALAIDPENGRVRNNFGVLLFDQGHREKAGAQFRKALSDPRYSTPQTAYYNLGRLARSQDRWQEAEGHFREALKRAPDYTPAGLALARLLEERGRLSDARGVVGRLLEHVPGSGRAQLLAGELALEAGEVDAARRYFRKAARQGEEGAASGRARERLRELQDPEAENEARKG